MALRRPHTMVLASTTVGVLMVVVIMVEIMAEGGMVEAVEDVEGMKDREWGRLEMERDEWCV